MSQGIYEQLARYRNEIVALARRYGARNVRVFGAVARREENEGSDLDLLVTMEPGRTLLDVAGLLVDLQDLLECGGGIVTEGGLRHVLVHGQFPLTSTSCGGSQSDLAGLREQLERMLREMPGQHPLA